MPQDNPNNPSSQIPSVSQTPFPEDHLRTLIEYLRPGGADLARRWIAALMLAPAEERVRIVEAVERRIVEMYAFDDTDDADVAPQGDDALFHVAQAPVEREGRIEQIIHTYARASDAAQRDAAESNAPPVDSGGEATAG